MIEVRWNELDSQFASQPSALTVGVFDGLHLGHRALVRSVTETTWTPTVVTFERHPAELLLHDNVPGFLMSREQKRAALRASGVEISVLVDFDEAFRSLPGRLFLERLAQAFTLRRLVVGHDFRCGYRLDTDIHGIRDYFARSGVEVIEVEAVAHDHEPVSSTRVRRLVLSGAIDEAARLLGRPYVIDLADEAIMTGDGHASVATESGTVLPFSRQLVPPAGRYRARTTRDPLGGESPANEAWFELEITGNSLRWPLAGDERIRYIVLSARSRN